MFIAKDSGRIGCARNHLPEVSGARRCNFQAGNEITSSVNIEWYIWRGRPGASLYQRMPHNPRPVVLRVDSDVFSPN